MKPWLRSTISIISAKKSFSSVTVSSAERVRVMAVKPRMSRNSTQTVRRSLCTSASSSCSTTTGDTCWPNRLVTRSRAAAAATEFSNCWRSVRATIAAATPASISMTLRLK